MSGAERALKMDSSNIDPSQIRDASWVGEPEMDAEIEQGIQDQMAMVGPILNELFKAAATDTDLWLKKKSLAILSNWILSLQNVATLMEQQLDAASRVVAAQEKELEESRPHKKKIWTPGI